MAEPTEEADWGLLSQEEKEAIQQASPEESPFLLGKRDTPEAAAYYSQYRAAPEVEPQEVVEEDRPETTSVLEQTAEELQPEPVEPVEPAKVPEQVTYQRPRMLPEKEDAELAQQQEELLAGLNKFGHSTNPEGGGDPLTLAQFHQRMVDGVEGRYPQKVYLPGEGSHRYTKLAQSLQEYSGWHPLFAFSRDAPEMLGGKSDMYRPATSIPYYGQRRGFQRPLAWAMGREGFTGVREGETPFITEALGLYEKPSAEQLGVPDAASSRELIEEAESKIIETGKRVGFQDFEPLLITPAAIQLLRLDLQRMNIPQEQAEAIPLEYVAPIWHRVRKNLEQTKQAEEQLSSDTFELKGTARTLGEKEEKDLSVEVALDQDERLQQQELIQGKASKSAKDTLKNAQIKQSDYDLFQAVKELSRTDIQNYDDYARVVKQDAYAAQRLPQPLAAQELEVPLVYMKGLGWSIDLNKTHHAVKLRRYRELWAEEMSRLEAEGLTPNQAVEALEGDAQALSDLAESSVDYANKRILTFLSARSNNAAPSWYVKKSTPEYLAEFFDSDAPAPETPVTPILRPDQMRKFMGPWLEGLGLFRHNIVGAGDIYVGATPKNISTNKLQEALRTDPSTVIGSWLTSWEIPESKDPGVVWESLWDHWGSREHYELLTTGKFDLTERFYDLGDKTAEIIETLPGGDYITPDTYAGKKALGLTIGIPWLVSPINPDPLSVFVYGLGKVIRPLTKGLKLAQAGTTARTLESIKEMAEAGATPVEIRRAIGDSGIRKPDEILTIHDTLLAQEIQGEAADVTSEYARAQKNALEQYQAAQKATQEAKKTNNEAAIKEAEYKELLAKDSLLEAEERVATILAEVAKSELDLARQARKAAGKPEANLADFKDVSEAHKAIQSQWEKELAEPLEEGGSASKGDAFKIEYQYRYDRKVLLDDYEEQLAAAAKTYGQEVTRTATEVATRQELDGVKAQIGRQEKVLSKLSDLLKAFQGKPATVTEALAQKRKDVVTELEQALKPPKDWGKSKVAQQFSKKKSLEEKWALYLKNNPTSRPAKRIKKLREQLDSLLKQIEKSGSRPLTVNPKRDFQVASEALEKLKKKKRILEERLVREMEARWRRGDALREVPKKGPPPLDVQKEVGQWLERNLARGDQELPRIAKSWKEGPGPQIYEILALANPNATTITTLPYDPRRGSLKLVDPDRFAYSLQTTDKGRPTGWKTMSYDDLYALKRSQDELAQAATGPKSPPITFPTKGTAPQSPSTQAIRDEVLSSLDAIKKQRDDALQTLAPNLSFTKKALNDLMKLGTKLDQSSLQLHRLTRQAELQLAENKLLLANKAVKGSKARRKAFKPQLTRKGIKTPSEAQEALIAAKKKELAAKEWSTKLTGAQGRVLQQMIDTVMANRALLRRGGGRLEANALERMLIETPELVKARLASLIGRGLPPLKAAERVIEDIPKYVKYEGPGVKIERIADQPAVALARTDVPQEQASTALRQEAPGGWGTIPGGEVSVLPHGLSPSSAVKTADQLGQKVNELRTGEAVSKWLAKNAEDEDQRLIAKLIAPIVGDIPIMVVTRKTKFKSTEAKSQARWLLRGARGVYVRPVGDAGVRHSDYIVIDEAGQSVEVILHELLHAATANRLSTGMASPASTEMGKAARELMYLFEVVKKERKAHFEAAEKEAERLTGVRYLTKKSPSWPQALLDNQKYPSLSFGGYTPYRKGSKYIDPFNTNELITYGFTNKEFRDYLRSKRFNRTDSSWKWSKSTPVSYLQDGWSTFVKSIRKLLGIPKKAENSLGNLIAATDKLIASPYEEVPRWLGRKGDPSLPFSATMAKIRKTKPENFLDELYPGYGISRTSRESVLSVPKGEATPFRVIDPSGFREILEDRYGPKIVEDAIKLSKKAQERLGTLPEGDPRLLGRAQTTPLHEILESTEEAFPLTAEDVLNLQDLEDGFVLDANNFWLKDQNLALMAMMNIIRSERGHHSIANWIAKAFRTGAVQNQEMSDELRRVHAAAEHAVARFYDEVENAIIRPALKAKLDPDQTVDLMLDYMDGTPLRMGSAQTKMGETFMNSGVNLWDSIRVNLANNARWVVQTEEAGKLVDNPLGELGLQLKTIAEASLEKKGVTQLSVREKFLDGRTPTPELEAEAALKWNQTLGRQFEKELTKVLGPKAKEVFNAGDEAIPRGLKALSKVWLAQDETIQSLASNRGDLLLRRAFVLVNTSPDFPTFMESLRRSVKFDPELKQLLSLTDNPVRAYHAAILASGQAKVENQATKQMFRVIGPSMSNKEVKAMNAIITGDYSNVEDSLATFDRALGMLIDMGIPINRVTVNRSLKEGARTARKIERIAEDPTGMNAFFPTDAVAHFDQIMGQIEKEMEAAFEQQAIDEVAHQFSYVKAFPNMVKSTWAMLLNVIRLWRQSVVTGLFVPNPRHWTNTSVGNFGQIWQEEGLAEAAKFSFLALPTNIPFVGRAYQDAMIRKAQEGDRLGTYTASVFNPHLQEFWNMPTAQARKTFLTDAKGRVHNLQDLRLRAAQDGILSTFEAERGLLTKTTVRALTGKETAKEKAWRKVGDWNTAIAKMMVYGEQRARTAFWLDKVLVKGLGYDEARKRTFNALYDWKHGIPEWERRFFTELMTFWRWYSLAARRHAAALTEGFGKTTLREVALGQTKLGRVRKQLQVGRSLDEFAPSSFEDDTQPELETRKEALDALVADLRPWYAIDRLGGPQRAMPLDHSYELQDVSGKLYTHYAYVGPELTAASMHTYYLYMASGISILGAQLFNTGLVALGGESNLVLPQGEFGSERLAGVEYITKPLVDMLLPLYQAAVQEQLGGYRSSWRTRPLNLGESILIEKLGGPQIFNLFGADIHPDNNNRYRTNSWGLQVFRHLPFVGSQLPTILSNTYTANLDMKDDMAKGMVTMLGNFLGFRKVPTNPMDELKWEMKKIERSLKEEEEAAKLPMSRERISDLWTE